MISFVWWPNKITLPEEVIIAEGQSISKVYSELWLREKIALRKVVKANQEQADRVAPGTYSFSWAQTPEEVLAIFAAGPQKSYNSLTILEWWSIYDVDNYLVWKWLAAAWEYIDFVTSPVYIERYSERYPFIAQAIKERWSLSSFEGYLMPSTYFVDPEQDTIDQLVYLQLEQFKKVVWEPYSDNLLLLSQELQSEWYQFELSTYGALVLASVVEKEERVPVNRKTITSVFYNRLNDGMRLDADITLCYGLQVVHTDCTPDLIVRNLYDTTNPYNTRAVWWMPPTPITSPTLTSITALWESVPSDNYYYLHDPTGQIHVGSTIAEHNSNKVQYLQ